MNELISVFLNQPNEIKIILLTLLVLTIIDISMIIKAIIRKDIVWLILLIIFPFLSIIYLFIK